MIQYAPCPQCRQSNAQRMSFTWWGGLIGPRVLTHVKCHSCGKTYNGKTGKDNTTNIIIYSIAVFAVVIFLLVFLFGLLGVLIFTLSK